MSLFHPKRYQLNKISFHVLKSKHPWIFRSKLNDVAKVFRAGQWLELFSPDNRVVGYGIYDDEGLIGVRIIKVGIGRPDANFLDERIDIALKKRKELRNYTDGYRALHGENDGIPGVVFDVYGDVGVLQTYSSSVDSLGRFVSVVLRKKLDLKSVFWKKPVKRKRELTHQDRLLYGQKRDISHIREGSFEFYIPIAQGQKSGAFLDLRGLRKWVQKAPLRGKRVLNLFSYTGMIGPCAESAGASQIFNVDVSDDALQFGKKYHAILKEKYHWQKRDIFKDDLPREKFDLIIVDPPLLASHTSQVKLALLTYKKLIAKVRPCLFGHGFLVICCCTSRIERSVFESAVSNVLKNEFELIKNLSPEDDHPVAFKEGDYLKILIFKKKR